MLRKLKPMHRQQRGFDDGDHVVKRSIAPNASIEPAQRAGKSGNKDDGERCGPVGLEAGGYIADAERSDSAVTKATAAMMRSCRKASERA